MTISAISKYYPATPVFKLSDDFDSFIEPPDVIDTLLESVTVFIFSNIRSAIKP